MMNFDMSIIDETKNMYAYLFFEERCCTCKPGASNGVYTDVVNGRRVSRYCPRHYWNNYVDYMQARYIALGLTLPIPKRDPDFDKSIISAIGNDIPLRQNPYNTYYYKEVASVNSEATTSKVAAYFASEFMLPNGVAIGRHLVINTNRTFIVTATMQQLPIVEVLSAAPVVIIYDNLDRRNDGAFMQAVISRPSGVTIIIKDKVVL